MPAATALIIASLAVAEPPRPPRPFAFLQTGWSLSASPTALAAAQDRPIVGPGQVIEPNKVPPPAAEQKRREVIVLPAPDASADELDDFDKLEDPAAQAAPGDAAAAETAPAPDEAATEVAGDVTTDAAAVDPLEDELALQLKPADDPLEGFNRVSFAVSMAIDKVLLRPLALTYTKITPKPARDGLRNVLAHWGAPIILANDLLQLKPKRALRTLARFLVNTLLGIGGLFDVAKEKKFNLPHHGNRFSNTLAMYGVKAGPYIYLPILGPTTLRDQTDRLQNFIPGFDNPVFRSGRGSALQYLLGLEDRSTTDQELKALLDDSVDPYATFRETWLQDRQGEVDRLKAPDGKEPGSVEANPLDDPLNDPASDPAADPAPSVEAPSVAPEAEAAPQPIVTPLP